MREPGGEAMKMIKKMMIVMVQIILGVVGGMALAVLVKLVQKRRVRG